MRNKIIYSYLLSLVIFSCSVANQEILINPQNLEINSLQEKNKELQLNQSNIFLRKSVPFGSKNESDFASSHYFKANANINSFLKNKPFNTKSLAIIHHPHRFAELNEEAYAYANNIPLSQASTHYDTYKDTNYQNLIRTNEYFEALKAIDNGFNEKSYTDTWNVINSTYPTGYAHYKAVGKNNPTVYDLKSTLYKNALLTNKIYREDPFFNANVYNPNYNIYWKVKESLDNYFAPWVPVNAYQYYMINKTGYADPSSNPYYQEALTHYINGYWEDSYLFAFPELIELSYSFGYHHYKIAGVNEGRLATSAYQNAVDVDLHSGETKPVELSGTKKTYRFTAIPNFTYRFMLNEINEGDSYIRIIDPDTNTVIVQNDDTYGLDSFVKFKPPLKKKYIVEVSTSNNGTPSDTPQGKFLLTMFHAFEEPVMIAKDDFVLTSPNGIWAYGGYDLSGDFYHYTVKGGNIPTITGSQNSDAIEYIGAPNFSSWNGGGIIVNHKKPYNATYGVNTFEANQIILYPGLSPSGDGLKTVLRFMPFDLASNFIVEAKFRGVNIGTTSDVSVKKGNTVLYTGFITGGNTLSFSNNSVNFDSGDTLDFIVGTANDGSDDVISNDSVAVDVTVKYY